MGVLPPLLLRQFLVGGERICELQGRVGYEDDRVFIYICKSQ